MADDTLGAVLLQLAQQSRLLGELGERQRRDSEATSDALQAVARRLEGTEGTQRDQAAALSLLARLERRIEELEGKKAGGAEEYEPAPTRRWWSLEGDARKRAVAEIRLWVEEIFRPGFGHLAAMLPPCWALHTFCLYTLDWLSELWSVLYLQPERTTGVLAGQAELITRLMQRAAEQMKEEGKSCDGGCTQIAPAIGAPSSDPFPPVEGEDDEDN